MSALLAANRNMAGAQLDESHHRLDVLDRAYAGKQGLTLASAAFQKAYDGRLAGLTSNFMRLVGRARRRSPSWVSLASAMAT